MMEKYTVVVTATIANQPEALVSAEFDQSTDVNEAISECIGRLKIFVHVIPEVEQLRIPLVRLRLGENHDDNHDE